MSKKFKKDEPENQKEEKQEEKKGDQTNYEEIEPKTRNGMEMLLTNVTVMIVSVIVRLRARAVFFVNPFVTAVNPASGAISATTAVLE